MRRKAIFNWRAPNEIIIICPGCGCENKLSELVFDLVQDRVEAKCTRKTCKWKLCLMAEGQKND